MHQIMQGGKFRFLFFGVITKEFLLIQEKNTLYVDLSLQVCNKSTEPERGFLLNF